MPLRNMTHKERISFVQEHIVHRFGMPQTLMTDQGVSFMSHQFKEFAESLKIKLLNSSRYCAQANGQAEASNRTLIRLIKKKIDDYLKRWHEVLLEALWVHRTSRHGATKVMSFELVYGQEAMLPVEVKLQMCQVANQGALSAEEYSEAMMDKLDDVSESLFKALHEIEKIKMRVAKAYNRRV
jgi:transposase InsO family protein